MITVFDIIDVALVSGVIVAAIRLRAWWATWAVSALVLYHLFGRAVAWQVENPLPELALMQLAVAAGYLFGPILSNYGRIVGSLFVIMSLSSVTAGIAGELPPLAAGLGVDLWNFQSMCLHVVSITLIIGINRHERLAERDRLYRHHRG